MLPSWCRDVVTIKRPTWRNSRGTKIADWTNPTLTTVGGCSLQISTTSSDLDGRQQAELSAILYAPDGTDIKRGDHVLWTDHLGDEHEFVVDGMAMPWDSPTGLLAHVEARLTEWRG